MSDEKKPGRKLIAGGPDNDESETVAIAAVKAFERAEKKAALYVSDHADVFDGWRTLLEKLEQKRVVADAAMRATDASFGPWKRTEQRTYDVALLCEQIGEPAFVELGGTITQEPVHALDKEAIEVAIVAKQIPAAVITAIRTITPKYSAPRPQKGPE